MLLNLDQTQTANVTVNITNITLGSTGTKSLLTGGTNLTNTSESALGNSFTVNLPARSIATYVIDAAPSLLGDFDGDGDVDGRDFLVWQRGDSPHPFSAEDLANWQENFGLISEVAASLAIPEPMSYGIAVGLALLTGVSRTPGRVLR